MNDFLTNLAEGLHGRRVQLVLGGLAAGFLASFLITEPWFGVPLWVVSALTAISIGLFLSSWVFMVKDGG